jgi:hypothetical protein
VHVAEQAVRRLLRLRRKWRLQLRGKWRLQLRGTVERRFDQLEQQLERRRLLSIDLLLPVRIRLLQRGLRHQQRVPVIP